MRCVIIGGGVAGVCCAETIAKHCDGVGDSVTLISPSPVLKRVDRVEKVTEHVEELQISAKSAISFASTHLKIIQSIVTGLDLTSKVIQLSNGEAIAFDKLCICAGASPKALHPSKHVLSLRDMNSVHLLRERLNHVRRVMIVGNGGIAMDLMARLKGWKNLIWVLKHEHVGDAYFDHETAEFMLEQFSSSSPAEAATNVQTSVEEIDRSQCLGEALGPNWVHHITVPAMARMVTERTIERECFVEKVEELDGDDEYQVRVSLTNNRVYDVDIVIAAIGVDPSLPWLPSEINRADDGGILVDQSMQTNVTGIHAAGDCCTMDLGDDQSPHWFQMRLWTQAKVMGIHAGECMAGVSEGPGMAFELFTHVTRFLEKRVILLGRYQLEDASDIVSYKREFEVDGERCYAKVVLQNGRVQGAILIGPTDLEETIENLILDKIDVSHYGEHLLDPDIDHVFD